VLSEKGVIASFRDVDPYSGAIKMRSTRNTATRATVRMLAR